jgi:demethylmenaquinone methyltransferase / 2-methoxy-6-polyprenyl-1,4-benzoquinol methylase
MYTTDPTSPAWDDKLLESPHTVADKRARVQKMFAAIACSYDLCNRVHSLWRDQAWRRKAVKLAKLNTNDVVVDVACGTGDLTMAFATAVRELREIELNQVIGIDFTYEMLPIARAKAARADSISSKTRQRLFKETRKKFGNGAFADVFSDSMDKVVPFLNGDALALPLPNQSADVVSIAFGIRNVSDPAAAIREFHRVLRPGGRVIILEFSLPTNPVMRGLYNFYFRKILPRTATLISGDKTGAYKYLPESVNTFIGREQMMTMMREAGFENVEQFPMTFGVCVCYRGVKR